MTLIGEFEIYKEFYKEILRLVRNSGKTTVISISEIEDRLIDVEGKLRENKE